MGLKTFLKLLEGHEIVRRYIIVNSFDGVLPILGIILVSFIVGIRDPHFVMLPCVGAAIAMFVSGVFGAYASERAEVKKSIRELETHLLRKIDGTSIAKRRRKGAFIVALVNGLSPMIAAFFIILPFFFSSRGVIGVSTAYYFAFLIAASILFLLGIFTGKIAKENVIKHGIIMLFSGIVIGVIFYALFLLGLL